LLPIDKTYLKTNLNNWKTAILDPAYIIQKETLPTASAQNLGKVFQYIGSDSTNYTIGGFYQCQVVSGTDPTEYAWVEITSKTSIDNTTIKENSSKQLYVPKATNSALGVVQAGDGIDVDSDGVISVVARLEEIAELPTAAAALEGKIYLLTATQTGYTRGGIYMCEESTETAGTYEWKLISTSPLEAGKGITIENNVISADTNVFTGTMDEWDALTPAKQAEYDFIATPDEAVEDIADAIIDGDMRAITSNAVAQVVPSDASSSNKLVTVADITPVGVILPYGGLIAPNNWFFCQGQAVSRTTYSELFAVISTAFGAGDGSTTFNLPDMREVVPVGIGQNDTQTIEAHDVYTLAQFKDDQLQDHQHTITPHVSVAHGDYSTAFTYDTPEGSGGIVAVGRTGTTTHGKRLGVNYIIKYA